MTINCRSSTTTREKKKYFMHFPQYIVLLYWTQIVEGSQPATRSRRNEDVDGRECDVQCEDMNVHMNLMYNMYVCCCHVL